MLLDRIKTLEVLTDRERFQQILSWLAQIEKTPQLHQYSTGTNIVLKSSLPRKIGIGSHFDTVPGSPGANDNGSAVVVCLELAKRLSVSPLEHLGVEIFFFDEEEEGLVGSRAYVKQFGLDGLIGFLNMELVGMGNRFGIWPVLDADNGNLLTTFEAVCSNKGITSDRYDRIIMNTADHQTFTKNGLQDSFTITCISDEDVHVAQHYYKAMEFDVDQQTLYEIIKEAPIFHHYHQRTDLSQHLSEESLLMTADTIWETLLEIDKQIKT